MRVTAVRKGYFGGKIRDAGEGFSIPDALMGDDKLRPSWVEPAGGASAPPAETEIDGSDGEPATRKRGRKVKQASSSMPQTTDEDDPTPGNGLLEALGGLPPDWLPADVTD